MYFLYRHVRLDTNEVFYIGMGKKPPKHKIWRHNTEYSRAYECAKRSKFWKNIKAKTEIRVDIITESKDKDFICFKEIEFIKLYGRRCCKEGTLVNFSLGGEFNNGPKNRDIKITQLSLAGKLIKVWNQPRDIQDELGYLKTNIVKCCRKRQITAYGYKWEYADDRSFDHIVATTSRKN